MKYLFSIFSLISIHSFGQKFDLKIDSVINLEIEKLKNRNINSIGYTKLTCINYGISTTSYLFWSEAKKTFIQKFEDEEYSNDKLRRFEPKLVTDSVFFSFYKKNSDALISENMKAFSSDPLTETVTSHSCYRNFRLFIDDTLFIKNFNFFDLEEFHGESKRNLNYKRNKDLKIVEWDSVLSKFIDELEAAYKFVEIRN